MPCRYQREEDVLVKRKVGDVFYNSTDHFFFPDLFFFFISGSEKQRAGHGGGPTE